jgi:GH15 family glucan-1,4-alpha-glucosidase
MPKNNMKNEVDERKIKELLNTTKEVIKNSSLPNGAIIASDVHNKIYPKDVKWYGYVWPRDASYTCYAADLLGLHKISKNFYKWCLERAEGFEKNGIFIAHKYYPNGRVAGDFDVGIKISDIKNKKLIKWYKKQQKVKLFYFNFQPDETASFLWSLYEHSKFEDVSEFKEIASKTADGICKFWKIDHFILPSHDLWEEHTALSHLNQVHTYSLAMCVKGLECASKLLNQDKWKKTINQMKIILNKCYVEKLRYFVRTFGKKIDKTIDSSMLGLVWPSEQFPASDERIVNTVNKILEKNEVGGGILRYANDKYDGKISFGDLVLGGGGTWPILNFWLSIYFSLLGKKEDSLKYFNWVVRRVEKYIPEQIKKGKEASIVPLTWSHAMFVISAKFLNLF